MPRLIRITAVAAMFGALSSCAVHQHPSGENPAIIVLPGAQDVQWFDAYDGHVVYNLRDAYPGRLSIEEIRSRLRDQGWQPRDRDLLNPTLTYAISARWRPLQLADGGVLAWSEQWRNSTGDVVMYGFKYAVSASGQDPAPDTPMGVHVYYFRAETAKSLESENARGERPVEK